MKEFMSSAVLKRAPSPLFDGVIDALWSVMTGGEHTTLLYSLPESDCRIKPPYIVRRGVAILLVSRIWRVRPIGTVLLLRPLMFGCILPSEIRRSRNTAESGEQE
ncbi:uncharacterized protein LOC143806402 isoform X2 [Ranitomeya variabilis]|uniref:uncharacterized protein LOC143806402 isoform X2 n=1 Tax=Ranitomeya variabilis TaxID=490064 RepID=UPI0040565E3C